VHLVPLKKRRDGRPKRLINGIPLLVAIIDAADHGRKRTLQNHRMVAVRPGAV